MSKHWKKFWDWMEDKEYGKFCRERKVPGYYFRLIYDEDGDGVEPTDKMLEGYMREYLAEHLIICQITTISEARNYYNILKARIEKGVE